MSSGLLPSAVSVFEVAKPNTTRTSTSGACAARSFARSVMAPPASSVDLLVLERHDVQVEPAALVHQPLEDRPLHESAPARLLGATHDDVAHAMGAGEVEERSGRVVRLEADHLGPELPRLLHVLE